MKTTELLTWSFALMLLLATGTARAQSLQADAGPDTVFCASSSGQLDSAVIGGENSATGGVPPYTYRWYGELEDTLFFPEGMHAGHVLRDTTQANPLFLIHDPGWSGIKLYLEVTDSIGEQSIDSVMIRVCGHGPVPLGHWGVNPEIGDTIEIWATNSNFCEKVSVEWFPKEHIISSPFEHTIQVLVDGDYVPNEHYAMYYTKDGCVSRMNWWNPLVGEVHPSGLSSINKSKVTLFPNPAQMNENLTLRSDEVLGEVIIMNPMGKLVYQSITTSTSMEIPLDLRSGIYFVQIGNEGSSNIQKLIVQ